jgi:hypothetical protein
MSVIKVETDIIAVSLIRWTMIQVIMYVETFKTDVIVFIRNITCLTSHCYICSRLFYFYLYLVFYFYILQVVDTLWSRPTHYVFQLTYQRHLYNHNTTQCIYQYLVTWQCLINSGAFHILPWQLLLWHKLYHRFVQFPAKSA